jgi:hypothetical protein
MFMEARLLAGFLFALLLAGCASLPQSAALRSSGLSGLPPRAELATVPFFPQEDYQCGPAALATVLAASGRAVTPEELVPQVYLPARQGSLQVEMLAATRRNRRLAYTLAPSLRDLLTEVAAGNPVIVLQNLGPSFMTSWHYAVVVGYDMPRGEVMLRSGTTERKVMKLEAFEFFWKDGRYWAMLAMPPEKVPATARETPYGTAVTALEKLGHVEEARQAYAAMLTRWPDSLVAMMGLGNSFHALGRLAEAETAFRRAATAHPDSAPAFNNLAQTLYDEGKYNAALAAALQAVALGGPALPAAQATLQSIQDKLAEPAPVVPASPRKRTNRKAR